MYLRAKFEVSSIILTNFRRGGNFTPPPSSTPQNERLKIPPRLGLKKNKFMAPFYGWGSTASGLEPLQGGSLLFTTLSLCHYFLKAQDTSNLIT